jgi:hypothetical protein
LPAFACAGAASSCSTSGATACAVVADERFNRLCRGDGWTVEAALAGAMAASPQTLSGIDRARAQPDHAGSRLGTSTCFSGPARTGAAAYASYH